MVRIHVRPKITIYLFQKFKAPTPSYEFPEIRRIPLDPILIPTIGNLAEDTKRIKTNHFIMATPEKPRERPSVLRSIIAGSTAGAVEIGT